MADDPLERPRIGVPNPAQVEGEAAPSASADLVEMVVVEDDGTPRAIRVVEALAQELAREPGRAYYAGDPDTPAGEVWDELAHNQLVDAVEPVSVIQGTIDNAVSGAVSMGLQREFMDPLERAALEKFDEENPMLAGTARWGSFIAATALTGGARAGVQAAAANATRLGLRDLSARGAWRTAAALVPGGSAAVAGGQGARALAAKALGVAPEAGKTWQRAVMRGAEFGVEGGLMEAQMAVTDALLEDSELSAEMILARGAQGALVGMGLGAAASLTRGGWRSVAEWKEGRKSAAERLVTSEVERAESLIPGPDADAGEVFDAVMRMSDNEFSSWVAAHNGSPEALAQIVEARPQIRRQLAEGRQQLTDDMVEVMADIADANRAARLGEEGMANTSTFQQATTPGSTLNNAFEQARFSPGQSAAAAREQTVAQLRKQTRGWLRQAVGGLDDPAQAAALDGGRVTVRRAGYETGRSQYGKDMKRLLGFDPEPGQFSNRVLDEGVDRIWNRSGPIAKQAAPKAPAILKAKKPRADATNIGFNPAAWEAEKAAAQKAHAAAKAAVATRNKEIAQVNALLKAAKPTGKEHSLLQQIEAIAARADEGGTMADLWGELYNYGRYRAPVGIDAASGTQLRMNLGTMVERTRNSGAFGTAGPALAAQYTANLRRLIELHSKVFARFGGEKAAGQAVRDNAAKVSGAFFKSGNVSPQQNLYVDLAEITRVNKQVLEMQGRTVDQRIGAPVLRAQQLLSRNMQNLEYLNALNQMTFKREAQSSVQGWTGAVAQFVFGVARGLAPARIRQMLGYVPTIAAAKLAARGAEAALDMVGAGGVAQRTKAVAAQAVAEARTALGHSVDNASAVIRGKQARVAPVVRVMGWSAQGALASLPESKREKAYHDIRMQVEALAASPEAMVQGMEVGTKDVVAIDPNLAQGMSLGAAKGLYAMMDAIPDDKPLNPLTGQPDAASVDQQKHFLRVVQAVNRPETLADEVAQGFAQEATLQTVRHVYPQTYALIITSLGETARKEKDVPYYTRLLLGDLTGMNFDATQEAPFISAMQSDYSQTPGQSAALGQVAAMQAQGNAQAIAFQQAARRLPGSTGSTAQAHRNDLERLGQA